MKRLFATCMGCLVIGSFGAPTASAHPPFKKAFQKRYVDSADNEEFKKTFRKAGCNTCHVKGEKKTVNNEYGELLKELVEGSVQERLKAATDAGTKDDELKKLLKELDAAFTKVESEENDQGQTYGDRIKSGELPVPLPPRGEPKRPPS